MQHTLPPAPQFYVTAPQPCPYLSGREERKLFTSLDTPAALSLNDALSHQGFRRSQNVIYRPSCASCNACQSARIKINEFTPSKSQKRVLRRNTRLIRQVKRPWATEEHFDLFSTYLKSRHADGGMAGMDVEEFAAMIEESPVNTQIIEYALETDDRREIVAVCLTDSLSDGLSMVYSFFNPDYSRDSIGSYMILDHIRLARELDLSYVYLGYWVQGSPKMDYKAKFLPLETFANGSWTQLTTPSDGKPPSGLLETDPIPDQVAAIHLPDV
ncbi:MAG: arginyltransferase [Rhodobacteraceae bacterium]|nr:arginyltransferase [Paracoccaceae bacterium]